MTTELQDVVAGARDTLIEQAEFDREFLGGMSAYRCQEWLSEHMHEAVDGAVPIYYGELFELVSDSDVWAQDTSDLGQPDSLLQAVQWAVYTAIEEAINNDESILEAVQAIAAGEDDE